MASDQLQRSGRGFGFDSPEPLDLRFDPTRGRPAWKLIDELDEHELDDLLSRYGQEPFSGRIAHRLKQACGRPDGCTAAEAAEAVRQALPRHVTAESRRHPATRVFQALRIATNDELRHLETILCDVAPRRLARGGRVAVITFHSLEDGIVKSEFRDKTRWQNLTPKPVTPRAVERKVNPRSRSAKLRAAERM